MTLANHKSLIFAASAKPTSINLITISQKQFLTIFLAKRIKSIEETITPSYDNIRFQLFKNFLECRNRAIKLVRSILYTWSCYIELNKIVKSKLIPNAFSIIYRYFPVQQSLCLASIASIERGIFTTYKTVHNFLSKCMVTRSTSIFFIIMA